MTTQDWYRRALGGARQTPGTPQAYVPQQQVPQGYQVPAGYRLIPDQTPQDQGIPWQQVVDQRPNIDTSTIPKGAVNAENFLEMAKFWKGGEARNAAIPCPSCGGVLFRRFEGRREAAPLCEQCGYNGMFTQGQGAVA